MSKSFKACDLVKKLVPNPPPLPSMKGVAFGTLFTPHMTMIHGKNNAWGAPEIVPFGNLSLPPQCGGLHYGLQCFEGMKAYRSAGNAVHMGGSAADGSGASKQHILLFRPDMNASRLRRSVNRLCFPDFDEQEFIKVLKEYVSVERDYIPSERGYSLYLRPSVIGDNDNLSASPSNTALMFIIASPVGPYFSDGFKPVKLLVEEKMKRAWPGGTGDVKLGSNYAAPMKAQQLLQKEETLQQIMKRNPSTGKLESSGEKKVKLQQVLWLGSKNEVQEVGAMNFMCLWKNKTTGKRELRTAPLDGCVLPGVTRDCILQLARQWGEFDVCEETYTIDELVEAVEEGRVEELFGCGTAAIVSPVDGLSYRGKLYEVPLPKDSVVLRMLKAVEDIQYGVAKSEWSVVVE